MQLGGTFLVNNKGEVLWSHLETFAGDHPDTTEILHACRAYLKIKK